MAKDSPASGRTTRQRLSASDRTQFSRDEKAWAPPVPECCVWLAVPGPTKPEPSHPPIPLSVPVERPSDRMLRDTRGRVAAECEGTPQESLRAPRDQAGNSRSDPISSRHLDSGSLPFLALARLTLLGVANQWKARLRGWMNGTPCTTLRLSRSALVMNRSMPAETAQASCTASEPSIR